MNQRGSRGVNQRDDPGELIDRAVDHHQNGRFAEACEIYETLLQLTPNHPDILHLLGVARYQLGELDAAAAAIGRAISRHSADASYWSNYGNVLRAQDDLDGAVDAYQAALRIDPDLADASNNLANAYIEAGKLELAAETLDDLCRRAPNHAEAHNNRGIILKATGHADEARLAFERAIELRPDYGDALVNLGNTRMSQGEAGLAAEAYRAALAADPHSADFQMLYGRALAASDDPEAALTCFQRAVELEPTEPRRLVALAAFQGRHVGADSAASSYQRALRLDPQHADALVGSGVIEHQRGNLATALELFDRALAADDDHLEARVGRANVLIEKGDLSGAERDLTKIRQAWPQFVPALQSLADVYERQGRFAKCDELLQAWCDLAPNDPVARHMLAAARGTLLDRCSDAYVRAEFDSIASLFDQRLLNRLDYRGPALLETALDAALDAPGAALDVLDAGCGTGLAAGVLRPYARRLDGVDLSQRMLDEAGRRGGYDGLHCDELIEFLNNHQDSYDLLVLLDVLIYVGRLEPLFDACRVALRNRGLVVFSAEALDADDRAGFQLQRSGRFAHSERYQRKVVAGAAFELSALRSVVLRRERERSVWGWLGWARAASIPAAQS